MCPGEHKDEDKNDEIVPQTFPPKFLFETNKRKKTGKAKGKKRNRSPFKGTTRINVKRATFTFSRVAFPG